VQYVRLGRTDLSLYESLPGSDQTKISFQVDNDADFILVENGKRNPVVQRISR
jgi:hypothetical protein